MVWSHPGHLCVYGKLFFNVAAVGAQHVHSPAHELVSARNALRKTAAARYPFGGIRKRSKLSANKFKYKMKASRYRKTIPKGFHIFV